MNIFTILVVQPILNLLALIYQVLTSTGIPFAFGFSIILLTIVIRLLLSPLMAKQLLAQKKMQEMAPHLSKIKEKHKGDMRAQQEATMALYREHGINPAAGCLPALIQLPVFFGLYTALMKAVESKNFSEINSLLYADSIKLEKFWNTDFFGLPLGKTPGDLIGTVGVGILLVCVATGVLQFLQSKMLIAPKSEIDALKKSALPAKEEKKVDFASTFQKQTLYFLPIMIGVFSYGFPVGLSLYWNTFTVFGIIQQYRLSGWGGLSDWIDRKQNNK
jgi:YidC/Oxa1 family membrane protein insertase